MTMPATKRQPRCATGCEASDTWLRTCRHCGNPLKEVSGFIGYDVLPMGPLPPALPGEPLDEYFSRVYGMPYPHERLWPGTMFAEDA